jgi:hypothetical protein
MVDFNLDLFLVTQKKIRYKKADFLQFGELHSD